MDGVAPVDEERDRAAGECLGGESPPQRRAPGGGPLQLERVPGVVALGAGVGDAAVEVVSADRPGHQARMVERVEAERARPGRRRLIRVGGDELQIRALAEAEEG